MEPGGPIRVKAPLLESLSLIAVRNARQRLSRLIEPAQYLFALYSATNPIPFCPSWIHVTRETLSRSTRNNRKLGSVYNNWSLPTVFDESERPFLSSDDVRKRLNMTKEQFQDMAARFFAENHVCGNPTDISTWSGLDPSTDVFALRSIGLPTPIRGLFRAAGKSSSYCILRDIGIVALGKVEVASMERIRLSLDKIFIAMNICSKVPNGVAVPALHRFLVLWIWLVLSIALLSYFAYKGWAGLDLWTMDYFQAIIFVVVSLPALVEYVSDEPSVIRNALRANRTLWKNSQVRDYFRLSPFDYAVMALINDPMWLVSDDKACFTQQGGHPGMVGDVPVTDTHSLRQIGFYVGRSMARREWEHRNLQVANRTDGSVHIFATTSTGAWISGEGENRPVG